MNAFEIYTGSNGEATKAMYDRLETLGPIGIVAANLFRAQKCSDRAKLYRRGAHKREAYGRKTWSMGNLAAALTTYGEAMGIVWGWKRDPAAEFHAWVLYVHTSQGQVSFHTDTRGQGPDYPGEWDGMAGQCAGRVVAFTNQVLNLLEAGGSGAETMSDLFAK